MNVSPEESLYTLISKVNQELMKSLANHWDCCSNSTMLLWCLVVILGLSIVAIYRESVQNTGRAVARRRLSRQVVMMITVYLGLLAVLLGFENKLIYHPLSAVENWTPPPGLKTIDLTLRLQSGEQIHAWWCPQEGAKYTIHFSHGNAANLSNHAWIIPEMRKHLPCNVLIYDYPGYGKSTGSPSETGCYASAEAAYDWLTDKQGVSSDNVIIMGQSLGCSMACHVAMKKKHKALVLISPFTTIRDRGQELMPIFPVKWLMNHRYDNRSKLIKYQNPLLIGHSTADEVIPIHHGKELFNIAGSKVKQFHAMQGLDHNTLDPMFFEAMKNFLDQQ